MGETAVPLDRAKPWGTAHAVLCAKEKVREPFAVINADDFYGRDAFEMAHEFLTTEVAKDLYSIIGYDLAKTLSEHGTVSRGVCEVDKNNFLKSIVERTKIYREGNKIVYEDDQGKHEVPSDAKVSMNFWCFHDSVFPLIESWFKEFVKDNIKNPKAEFFIPIIGDLFVKSNKGKIKVIPTKAQWFGVTYKEDAPVVQESLMKLVRKGEYPERLW